MSGNLGMVFNVMSGPINGNEVLKEVVPILNGFDGIGEKISDLRYLREKLLQAYTDFKTKKSKPVIMLSDNEYEKYVYVYGIDGQKLTYIRDLTYAWEDGSMPFPEQNREHVEMDDINAMRLNIINEMIRDITVQIDTLNSPSMTDGYTIPIVIGLIILGLLVLKDKSGSFRGKGRTRRTTKRRVNIRRARRTVNRKRR